ncbi:MAG: hypothetical protein JNM20_13565 [Rhizobiales bacterium]|nr:hypothetical protein [Hyphomicrobiales bacterium]
MEWAHDIRDLSAAVTTALLYVVPPIAILLAILFFARRRRKWAWASVAVAIVFLLPFAVFLVVYYLAVTFPERRAAEISALARDPVPAAARPRALAVVGEMSSATRLLAVGFVDAIIQHPDGLSWPRKLLFTPRRDVACIEENLNPMSFTETLGTAMLARSAYLSCAAQTRLVEAPADGPPIQLLRDKYAPLAIPNRPGVQSYNFTYRAWQLRWSPARGGGLIDYGEILYVEEPSYYISWRMGFHHGRGRPAGERRDLDSFEFVARALGLDPSKDVPFAATTDELTESVAILVARLNAGKDARGDALRMLLGQWGDVAALRQGLASLDPGKAGGFVASSLAILADSNLDARRRALYPRLHEYSDLLVTLCPQTADPSACEKILPEIEKRSFSDS